MKKRYLFFNALLVSGAAMLLSACAQMPLSSPLDSIVPTPTVLPLQVSLDASVNLETHSGKAAIILRFNQPMDFKSSDTPLLVSPPLSGTFSWDDTQTVLAFMPQTPFIPQHAYTLSIDSRLAARDGQRFELKPHWIVPAKSTPRVDSAMVYNVELIDGEEKVVSQSPNSMLHGRRPVFELTFDHPMAPESVAASLSITPEVPHGLTWEEQTLAIHFEQALEIDSEYSVTLSTSARDLQGAPLDQEYAWTLRTKALVNSYREPHVGDRTAPIAVRFNYPMDPQSVVAAWNITPEIDGEMTWDEALTTFTFTSLAPLPPDEEFTYGFEASLRDAFGDPLSALPLRSFSSPPSILSYGPEGASVPVFSPVRITFDRLVDEESVVAALRISPPISGSISWDETALTFVPDQAYWEPRTVYTITLLPEVTDREGQRLLNSSYSWSFDTLELARTLSFGMDPNIQVLDADGRRAVQFAQIRFRKVAVEFELYALSLEQFLERYDSGTRDAFTVGGGMISSEDTTLVETWTQEVAPPSDNSRVALETFVPADVPPGLYLLNLNAEYLNDQLLVVLTRNTMMVKQSGGQIMAWVTDIAGGTSPDGAAREAVKVNVYAADSTLLGEGGTDADGSFRAAIPAGAQPAIVVAQSAGDITVSGLSNEWHAGYNACLGKWRTAPVAQDHAVYITTDRPIYRPGQNVYFKAVVRRDDDALLGALPAGTALLVQIRDAHDDVVQTFDLATNEFGSVFGEYALAEDVLPGDYAVEILIAGEIHRQKFQVEEYRAADSKVNVTFADDVYVAGEQITITIDAATLAGDVIPDAAIEIKRFCLGQRYYNAWQESGEAEYLWYEDHISPSSAETDDQGRYTFSIAAALGENGCAAQGLDPESTLFGIEASLDDDSYQAASDFAVYRVFGSAEQLRVNAHGQIYKPDEPFSIEGLVTDIDAAPVAGRELSLTLRSWNPETAEYDRIVQELPMLSDDEGRVGARMAIAEPAFYRLWVDGADDLGNPLSYRSYVYIFDDDLYANWSVRGESLVIGSDLISYAPGDVAKLVIESEFDGPALLTFERAAMRREQVVELTAPLTVIEVPVLVADVPNIYVSVSAWRANDTTLSDIDEYNKADSELLTAQINLNVPLTETLLNVSVTSDKTTYAPGAEANFTLRVSDQLGNPVVAEVSLTLVDEVLAALSEVSRNPIADAFYHARENNVRTYHSMALRRKLLLAGPCLGDGSGGQQGFPRSDFADTSVWFPVLLTDANGEAQISLTMPATAGRWRVTAAAITVDSLVGDESINVSIK